MVSKLICGYGFVGKAVYKMFPESNVFEKERDGKRNQLYKHRHVDCEYCEEADGHRPFSLDTETIYTDYPTDYYDVCFVCVPTPMKEDGSCDTSAVFDVVRSVNAGLFIIRSTVSPGTTDELNKIKPCVFQPEYIGESTAHPLISERSTPFAIFGGPQELTDKACEVYQEVYNASVRFYQVSALEAELIKYMENSAIGTMVTLCNEFYEICKTFGVSYNKVREGFLLDPRMSRYFTFVYEQARGFGGKCIPKDMNAIVASVFKKGNRARLLESVLNINKKWQT